MAVFCLDFIIFLKIYRPHNFHNCAWDVWKIGAYCCAPRLLAVGVLISKLHPCTRCRKSSFTERSFIIAWLSLQFPEVPKVRVNNLIFFSHLFFPLFSWWVPSVPSIVLIIKLILDAADRVVKLILCSIKEKLELEQSLPENYWSIIILFIWLSTMSLKLTRECIFSHLSI